MTYQFDAFTLDEARRELRRGEGLVAVEPQVFDLLALLIRERDRVVSRDDLVDAVWGGRIVSEATLASRINAARAAVGDSGAAQRLIRTLPRRGLRFVGEVLEAKADIEPPPTAARRGGGAASRSPSVAVLPFANIGGEPAQDFFADGVAEEIITALSRISGLFVVARNSSFTYKGKAVDVRQVGRDLGVDYVLEGGVRRGGGRLRITGQLVDAATGAHLWADRFEGDAEAVFALQDQVAERVAAVIEPTLELAEIQRLRRAPPASLDAYDLLLRSYAGLGAFTPESLSQALTCLEQALALEPAYPQALAAAAYVRALHHFQGWSPQDDTQRAEAVSRAFRAAELASNDAQVLWMAAFAIWNMAATGRDAARALFERSLQINPNSAMALTLSGWIEAMCGRTAEGRAMVERAQALSPRDPRGWLMVGVLAVAAVVEGDYAQALVCAERALAQNRRFAVALRVAAVSLAKLGEMDRAKAAVRDLLTIEPELTVSSFLARIPVPLASMRQAYSRALHDAGLPP